MDKRTWEVANELDTDVLTIIKTAKEIGYRLDCFSEEQVETLERKLSGYYDLSDKDIRKLEDFLYSEKALEILTETSTLLELIDDSDEDKEKELLRYIAKLIYERIDDEKLKSKLKPETIYETIRNLGVIKIYRMNCGSSEKKEIPTSLLRYDRDLTYHILRNYFLTTIQKQTVNSVEDFEEARASLSKKYKELKENVRQQKS